LGATGVRAAGYDDFAQGLSAFNRGDNDRAIALFTSALAAGDLNANLVPVAYLDRARAQLIKGDCASAIPDLSAALKARPDNLEALHIRGDAERCAGSPESAIVDYTQAIALKPDASGYWGRGLSRWDIGDFADAATDFASAAARNPKWPYPILWFDMARFRAGAFGPAEVRESIANLNVDDWPGPLFDLFAGNATPDDVFHAAADGDPKIAADKRCEANFYVGEWWLLKKNPDAAKPLLQDAATNCRHDFVEYFAAATELKRIK